MPIYEYLCIECENIFDKLVSFSNSSYKDAIECPECGSNNTKKLMSAFSSSGELSSVGSCGPAGGGFT